MATLITFDESTKEFVLKAFGKTVDADGYVSDNSNRVLTPRGEDIPVAEFAGVRKGSVVLVKNDIVSLIEATEALK